MSTPADWKKLWSRARGIHAGSVSYQAVGSSSSGSTGSSVATEVRAFSLTYAAGKRLLLQVGKPGQEQVEVATAAALIWGTPGNYFSWRPVAGVESLGGDFKLACSRCALAVPRIHELLEFLFGRDLIVASPHAAQSKEVGLSDLPRCSRLSWRSEDGITLWEADLRHDDSALLRLRSATDPEFEFERALSVTSRRLGIREEELDQRERLRGQLTAEREEPMWHCLTLQPKFELSLDETTFQVAPP